MPLSERTPQPSIAAVARPTLASPSAIYPLDYGHLPGTTSGDSSGIDVWIGSLTGSVRAVTGAVVTIDLLKADSEVKVLLGCTAAEMRTVLEWHNRGEQSGILTTRPGQPE